MGFLSRLTSALGHGFKHGMNQRVDGIRKDKAAEEARLKAKYSSPDWIARGKRKQAIRDSQAAAYENSQKERRRIKGYA
jgi:hypothetical protein